MNGRHDADQEASPTVPTGDTPVTWEGSAGKTGSRPTKRPKLRRWVLLLVPVLGLLALSIHMRLTTRCLVRPDAVELIKMRSVIVQGEAGRLERGVGDRLVAVAGREVSDRWQLREVLCENPPDSVLDFEFATSDGQRISLALPVVDFTLFNILGFGEAVFFGFLFLVLVGRLPPSRPAIVFASILACEAARGAGYTLPLTYAPGMAVGFWAFVGSELLVALVTHFMLVFPYPLDIVRRRPYLVALAYGLICATGVRVFFLASQSDVVIVLTRARLLVFLATAALLVVVAYVRLRDALPPLLAAKVRLVAVAGSCFVLPAAVVAARWLNWPPLRGDVGSVIYQVAVSVPLLVMAYAVVDLDPRVIDVVVRRTALVVTWVLVVFLLCVGCSLAWARLTDSNPSWLFYLGLLLAATGPATCAAVVVHRRLYRILRRLQFDSIAVLRKLRTSLRQAVTDPAVPDWSRLTEVVEATLDLEGVAFWRHRHPEDGQDDLVTVGPTTSESLQTAQWQEGCRLFPQRKGSLACLTARRRRHGGALAGNEERVLEVFLTELSTMLEGLDTTNEIPGYKRVRFIAAGGMGAVYLAERLLADRDPELVALKVLKPDDARRGLVADRFRCELALASELAHPNIVRTIDTGNSELGLYLAMEYVEGGDLASLLAAQGEAGRTLPVEAVISLGLDICAALDHVHRVRSVDGAVLGLIHCDISPGNILISSDGMAKLSDFGVVDQRLRDGVVSSHGKRAYLAPERMNQAGHWDHRVDIYALGVVLYEALCGQDPFGQRVSKSMQHAGAPAEMTASSLALLRPDLPTELVACVGSAMAAEPADRFATVAALAQSLCAVCPRHSQGRVILSDLICALAPRGQNEGGPKQHVAGPLTLLDDDTKALGNESATV